MLNVSRNARVFYCGLFVHSVNKLNKLDFRSVRDLREGSQSYKAREYVLWTYPANSFPKLNNFSIGITTDNLATVYNRQPSHSVQPNGARLSEELAGAHYQIVLALLILFHTGLNLTNFSVGITID